MTHLEGKPALVAGFAPARLGFLDYLFRGLSVVGLLEIAALIFNLTMHPHVPGIVGQSFALRIVGGLGGSYFLLVGALVVWRIPGNATGYFLVLLGLQGVTAQFDFKWGTPTQAALALEGLIIYVGGIGIPSLGYLMLHFPTGRIYPPNLARWIIVFAALKFSGAVLEVMASPSRIAFFTLPHNPLLVSALVPYRGLIAATIGVTGLLLPLGLLASLISLALRYRASSAQERQQIKWMVWAFGLMVPLMLGAINLLLTQPSIVWRNVAFVVGVLGLSNFFFSISVSILRYRLWDIDLIINRTLVYAGLSTVVVGAYVLVVGYLGELLHQSGRFALSLLATGVIAVLFQPLRERLQRTVNRWMYGQRDEPYAVLARLGERLEAQLPSEHLLMVLVQTLTQVLRLPYAAVRLLEGQTFAYGSPRGEPLILPLVHQGERLGELLVSPRSVGEPFSDDEIKLLSDIAHQAGLAAQTVRLSAELQRSRAELVLAAEEERKRLRHDLHDGLGPALAGLALKLEAVREQIQPDPRAASSLLVTVEGQVHGLVGEIRRLVQNLRPPALDELGLAGALHRLADQCGLPGLEVRVETPPMLPPLPAAVEVATYRIAQEALTNVVRHARASACTLRLSLDHELILSVEDDGVGLPKRYKAGVGLQSMGERARALGGSLEVKPLRRGTLLEAHLPIARASV